MCPQQQIAEPFWYKLVYLVIGAVIGFISTYAGAIQIAKKNRRADANIEFYEAFREVIRDLDTTANPLPEISGIIRRHVGYHAIAAYKFKFFLTGSERKCFLRVWGDYHKKAHDKTFEDDGEINKRPEKRGLAFDYIYKLLKYADYEKE